MRRAPRCDSHFAAMRAPVKPPRPPSKTHRDAPPAKPPRASKAIPCTLELEPEAKDDDVKRDMKRDMRSILHLDRFAACLAHRAGATRPVQLFIARAREEGFSHERADTRNLWFGKGGLEAVFKWDGRRYELEEICLAQEHGYMHYHIKSGTVYSRAYNGPLTPFPPRAMSARAKMLCAALYGHYRKHHFVPPARPDPV